MRRARHLSVTPGTAIALVALFFALGGSAFAVGERIQSPSVAQQRCTNGAVRGIATVTGIAEPGHGELPRQVHERRTTSSRASSTARARQCRCGASETGVFEVRFVGISGASAVGERGLRRLVRDREERAGRLVHRHDASGGPGRPRRPGVHARGACSYGKRGETNAAMPPASSRSTPAIARKSHVISLSPGSRPSREPRLSYAFVKRLRRARLRELAAGRLGDRAQRLRIGRHRDDLPEHPAGRRRTARAR